MFWYEKLDRLAFRVAIAWGAYFLFTGQPETAFILICVWLMIRGLVCCVDVFHTFFTEKPLLVSNSWRRSQQDFFPADSNHSL